MWKTLLGLFVVGVAVLPPQPLAAPPWDYRPGLQGQDRRYPAREAPGPRGDGRERRGVPERDDRSRHRLSDEERRELHRDLDRAEREIYRRKGQR